MKNTLSFLGLFLAFLLLGSGNLYGQIKIGDNNTEISPFALFELESSSKGLLIPRMTSTQRDAAFNQDTPVGMMIYNTEKNILQYLQFEEDASGKRTNHKVWEGATDEGGGVSFGTSFPTGPRSGDFFYNDSQNALYVWNSAQGSWLPVGGANTVVTGDQITLNTEFLTYTNSNGATSTLDLSTLAALASNTLNTNQTLALDDARLSISNGNTVDLSAAVQAVLGTSSATAGPAGAPGAPGAPGANGADGSGFLTGTTAPSGSVASPTFYVNTITGDQYSNPGGGSTWTLLPSSDNQTLTAAALSSTNTINLSISGGNAVSIDLSALANPGVPSTANFGSVTVTQTLNSQGTTNLATTTISDLLTTNGGVVHNGSTTINSSLVDGSGNVGTAGQHLSSTGTGVQWVTPSSSTDSQTLAYGTSPTATQTTLGISDGNTLTLTASGSLSFNQTGTNTLELIGSAVGGSGTDSQTLAYGNSSSATQTTLEIADGNTLSLRASGSLSFNQTGTNTLELIGSAVGGSGTDSQTLAYGNSSSATQTTLEIADGNTLSLRASGSLSFNQTGTNTLELIGSAVGGSGTDSQTLAYGNSSSATQTTLEIADGNTLHCVPRAA